MPVALRRKLVVAALLVLAVVLTTAGAAAAANGGFTPPFAHSPNTHKTNTVYYVVLAFTGVIFVIVESALVLFMWKYRAGGRARTAEGQQVHGNTRLELMWTVVPVLILAVIAAIVFVELPGITSAPASAANTLQIKVEGHQFYWQFDYPNGARSINDLHVPVGQDVELEVVSADVLHSWWIPQLAGKLQAVPGRTNHTWFRADKTGTFYGQCAELCGPFHEAMTARVISESQSDYRSFISKRATTSLGRAEFQGVCATCHGMQGQGGYGPALSSNTLLTQRSALEAIVRNGRNLMPPVGNTWTDEQIDALAKYTKAHVYKGASTSGG
jgi:cytochrome c oxidase subunit II